MCASDLDPSPSSGLAIREDASLRFARQWLGMALCVLVVAGMLALILVLGRMPPFDQFVTAKREFPDSTSLKPRGFSPWVTRCASDVQVTREPITAPSRFLSFL